MKSIKDIKVGSEAFFGKFEDFKSKDSDVLHIMDEIKNDKIKCISFHDNGIDHILVMDRDKESLISHTIERKDLSVGKFMVPEVAEYYGVTIDDLKRFEENINSLDDKHKYYKKIYDAYLENGKFELTESQLLEAYEEYKKYRS